jgi:outer membrane protein TolC
MKKWIACITTLTSVTLAQEDLKNLSLKQAEGISLQNNKEIQLSEQEIGQFYARRLQAISAWFPQISFASMYVNLQKPQAVLGPLALPQYTMNQFQLNQPLFSTDLFFTLRTTSFYLKSTEINREIAVNRTLLHVRTLYFLVILKEVSLKVQKEVIDYLTNALNEEQKKYDAGRAISFEVNQSKVALSNAISAYHAIMKELKSARNDLIIALGCDPDKEKEINLSESDLAFDDFPEVKEKLTLLQQKTEGLSARLPKSEMLVQTTHLSLFSEDEIEKWIAVARLKRPEVKKSKYLVKAARQQVNYQKGRYLPEISGFIDYGYYYPFNGLFFPQQKNWASGVRVSWNIFDSFKREFQIKEAGFARESAKIEQQQTLDRTSADIRNQIYQIEEALFSYLSAYESLVLAEQSMKEAQVRLAAGTITPLDYRDATRSYAETHRQCDQAKYSLLHSYFQLRHAAGIDSG